MTPDIDHADRLPEVERLQAVDIRPGDTIIATVGLDTTREQCAAVKGYLEDRFPDNKVLVIAGIQLTAGRIEPA